MRVLWLIAGVTTLALAIVGIAVPLLPTVPFLLLTAICFAKSSERLHNWLMTHPRFGPPIHDWQESGAIRRKAKVLATLSVALAFGISVAIGLRPLILGIQAVVLTCVLVFIWSRPNG